MLSRTTLRTKFVVSKGTLSMLDSRQRRSKLLHEFFPTYFLRIHGFSILLGNISTQLLAKNVQRVSFKASSKAMFPLNCLNRVIFLQMT